MFSIITVKKLFTHLFAQKPDTGWQPNVARYQSGRKREHGRLNLGFIMILLLGMIALVLVDLIVAILTTLRVTPYFQAYFWEMDLQ